METTVKIIVLLAASPLMILTAHIALSRMISRIIPGFSRQIICGYAVLSGYIPTGLLFWFYVTNGQPMGTKALIASLYSLIVYSAIGYSYFHIFNMSKTARRIRILHEIKAAEHLKMTEVEAIYNAKDMFDVRIERLISMRQLRKYEGKYFIDGKMLYYAAEVVNFWGRVIKLPLLK